MALSTLRATIYLGCKNLKVPLARSSLSLLPKSNTSLVSLRQAHHRTLDIKPSKYEWNVWKDFAHFYTLLGLIPMALLIGYVNLTIGPAELVEIPEDYEPKHWEYQKHPISRWISRYITIAPEKQYELHLHAISDEYEKVKLRRLEATVKDLMGKRGDAKGWYYIPVNDQHVYSAREKEEEIEAMKGHK